MRVSEASYKRLTFPVYLNKMDLRVEEDEMGNEYREREREREREGCGTMVKRGKKVW